MLKLGVFKTKRDPRAGLAGGKPQFGFPLRPQAGPKPSLIGSRWKASRSLILTFFFRLEFSDFVIVRHCSELARALTGSPTPAHCQPSTFTDHRRVSRVGAHEDPRGP